MGDLKDKPKSKVQAQPYNLKRPVKMWKSIFGLGLSLDTGSDTIDTGSIYRADIIY